MKPRKDKFLYEIFQEPKPYPEVADYIQELHEYLWRFVRAEMPWANGDLNKYVQVAVEAAEYRASEGDTHDPT